MSTAFALRSSGPLEPHRSPVQPAELGGLHVSFEEFYRSSRAPIGRALAVTLRDTQLATEAVDEAMARAFGHWNKVRSLDNPGGWVYRVGLNWSRSVLRRTMRPAPPWATAPVMWGVPPPMDPAVDRALGELSTDQRAVVVCRLLLGLSEAETAAVLELRAGTVKSRLHRASQRLQSLLRPLHAAHHDINAHDDDDDDDDDDKDGAS